MFCLIFVLHGRWSLNSWPAMASVVLFMPAYSWPGIVFNHIHMEYRKLYIVIAYFYFTGMFISYYLEPILFMLALRLLLLLVCLTTQARSVDLYLPTCYSIHASQNTWSNQRHRWEYHPNIHPAGTSTENSWHGISPPPFLLDSPFFLICSSPCTSTIPHPTGCLPPRK